MAALTRFTLNISIPSFLPHFLRSSVHVIIIIISPVITHDSQVEDVWSCWGLLMSFSGRCYRCEDKCNISAALHLSHLLFQVISEEGAGINMQLQAVTGMGVVKAHRRIRRHVVNSSSCLQMTAWVVWAGASLIFLFQPGNTGTRDETSMNLYKSFGNLMETWVTDDTSPDSEWFQRNAKDPPTPSSEMETNGRSESVDSGVETASCDTCFRATSSFASTEIEGEDLTPALTSQSPVFSSPKPTCCPSSSPLLCSSSTQKDSTASHLKLEQVSQRTDSMYSKGNSKPLTPEEMLSRRPQASFPIKRHTSELVRGQRSDRLDGRRTVSPPVSIQPKSEMCRRTQSMISNRRTSEVRCYSIMNQALNLLRFCVFSIVMLYHLNIVFGFCLCFSGASFGMT